MTTNDYAAAIVGELKQALAGVPEAQVESLTDAITQAGRVFVAGAGRSGLMMRAFAMRLMHLGLDAYVVGETVTRSLSEGDLLIVGTGSGETRSLVPMAEKARSLGAVVAAFTIAPTSTIGRMADIVVPLPAVSKERTDGAGLTVQPMGSLFEQTLLLLCDSVILRLMEKSGLDGKAMYGNHANLE